MLKKVRNVGACIAFVIFISVFPMIKADAGELENEVNIIYNALVTDKQDSVTFTSTEDYSIYDYLSELAQIDTTDNLFDGMVLVNRGAFTLSKKGNSYTLTTNNGYSIDEADELTDSFANDILAQAGTDATDKELFYAMSKYLTEIYDYDESLQKQVESGDYSGNFDFVSAYYSNRKLICTEYATVAYLTGQKLGLDIEMIFGNGHVYNIIKFEGEDEYIAFDLTKDSSYSLLSILSNFSSIYHVEDITDETVKEHYKTANGTASYTYASISEYISEAMYLFKVGDLVTIASTITIFALALLILILVIRKKSKKRKRRV